MENLDERRWRMSSRNLLFYDATLPYPGIRPSAAVLATWQEDFDIVDGTTLAAALNLAEAPFLCLVWLHGSYFPEEIWPPLIRFLGQGAGLVVIGGTPFRRPCRLVDGQWQADADVPSYLHELGMHEVLLVSEEHEVDRWQANPDIPCLLGGEAAFATREGDHFVLHGSAAPDHPHESGSSGPIDSEVFPLLSGLDRQGRSRLASVVLVEQKRGTYAGGRWIFAHRLTDRGFWHHGGDKHLLRLAHFAQKGSQDLFLAPSYPSYYLHEKPTLIVRVQSLQSFNERKWSVVVSVTPADHGDQILWVRTFEVVAADHPASLSLPVDLKLDPGLYHVQARFTEIDPDLSEPEVRTLHQGFWGYDQRLLCSQERMAAGHDYFKKGTTPFPIVGTTYMASDVARKFLFQPNSYVFDQDMAAIREHGLNFVRTGLWTAWRHAMFMDGQPSEAVLRALDAFFLSANRHQLEVTFTFFSFTPEAWEGENPYLDPRSIRAQKRFIAAIVERHQNTTNVQWDLINEPSLFDPQRIFQGPRSHHDRFEIQAYRNWLQRRHQTIERLQSRWVMTPLRLPGFDHVTPPEPPAIPFDIQDVTVNKNGLPWLDYALFTMDMFNAWAKDLAGMIHRIAPAALVTAGQDEALSGQRPSPFFYQASVDYTTVHSWWLMDQLAWDGIFAKTPNQPNLVQETGIMYLEQANGRAQRTEIELAEILERKFAYAFGTRSAGAVQWIWNTNAYMNNVNESNIGALRVDGSEKPEAQVLEKFARFIESVRDWFVDRPLETVAVVYPYSNDLSHRRLAVEATVRLTQALSYDLKVPFRAVGEYQLDTLFAKTPRLIMVPSPHNFSRHARQQLLDLAKTHPVTIFWTGPVNLDEYWQEYDSGIAIAETPSSLARHEMLNLEHRTLLFPFDYRQSVVGLHGQRRAPGHATAIHATPLGQGDLLWCPLPVELSTNLEGLACVYRFVLESAQISETTDWRVEPGPMAVFCRRLDFSPKGSIFVLISEAAYPSTVTITLHERPHLRYRITVPGLRAVLVAADASGHIRASYGTKDITVEKL